MAEITWRPVRAGDLEYLVEHLRESDRLEAVAAEGPDVLGTLARGVALSAQVMIWECDGVPLAVVGVSDIEPGRVGCPWLMGTAAIGRHAKAFMASSRRYLEELRGRYPQLANVVWMSAVTSKRYLRRLGFVVYDDKPLLAGPTGEPFALFVMGAS